jgi:DNA modification methylase
MDDWKDAFKVVKINTEQRDKILKGKLDSHAGKVRLLNIFGKIPDSIWDVRHTSKLDIGERSQHNIAQEHRNDTLKTFDNSTRNQNVRWKGAISMFPRQILDQLLDFYTEDGDWFFDPFAGHNSRMEPAFLKGRNYIGWDCSKEFMKFNREVATRLMKEHPNKKNVIILKEGDSRNVDTPDNTMDFCFSSPPYWNIEWYGDEPEQLGKLSYEDFMKNITKIYAHCFRVLRPGKFCIINVNDFRKGGEYYSYHVDTVNALKSVGFRQFDHIILKYPNAMRKCFPNQIWNEKLMPKVFEHLLVFLKPDPSKKGAFPWLENRKA